MTILKPRRMRAAGLPLLALSVAAFPCGAAAQAVPPADEAAGIDGEEITVTGYRLQNRRAIDAKRESQVISEFVTQDDAGQNPDFNIADALRRVPGVSAVFDEDEGRYVAVRGLNPDYTLVTLNGMQLASSDQGSRRVLIEQVPASAVSRMQVIKSPTAQYDGNSIGGIVDLQTRSAFDAKGTYFSSQALIGYYDSNDVPGKNKLSYRGDATLTTRFGANDQFGIMLTGSYMERTRDQERILHNGYRYYTTAGAVVANPIGQTAYAVPNGTNYLNYTLTSKRFGGAGTLEFRPDDRLKASLYYGHYTQDDDETRYSMVITPVSGITPSTDGTTGRIAQGQVSYGVSQFVISKPVDTAQARLAYDFGTSSIDARASFSQARWDERGPGLSFTTASGSALGYSYDIAAPGFVFTNPATVTNAASYRPTTINSADFNVRERVKDGQIDYRAELGGEWTLGVGGKLKQTERTLDRNQPSWTNTSGLTLAGFLLDGADGYVPPYGSVAVPIPDRVAFWDYLRDNPGQFTVTTSALTGLASDYRFEEDVKAVYALIQNKGDRHSFVIGGRYEKTDVDVHRYAVQSGIAKPVRDQSDYGHFLPSAVGSYDITDAIKLRAAYGRAIGRPNQSDLAGGETRTDIAGLVTISRPNPELKPRVADNFDLSFEYYFDGDDGALTIGAFHKRIQDEIFRGTNVTVVGIVTTSITQPQNLETAKLTGIELNFVKNSLDFLPGLLANFGVSANYTYIHTDAKIVMADGSKRSVSQVLEQPSRLLNASLFYKLDAFEGRLSYSRPGKSYLSISTATPVDDVVYKPFNQVDLQLRYKLTDQVQLIAEGRNLLGESRDNYRPYYGEIREINQHGRGFWAGVSAHF